MLLHSGLIAGYENLPVRAEGHTRRTSGKTPGDQARVDVNNEGSRVRREGAVLSGEESSRDHTFAFRAENGAASMVERESHRDVKMITDLLGPCVPQSYSLQFPPGEDVFLGTERRRSSPLDVNRGGSRAILDVPNKHLLRSGPRQQTPLPIERDPIVVVIIRGFDGMDFLFLVLDVPDRDLGLGSPGQHGSIRTERNEPDVRLLPLRKRNLLGGPGILDIEEFDAIFSGGGQDFSISIERDTCVKQAFGLQERPLVRFVFDIVDRGKQFSADAPQSDSLMRRSEHLAVRAECEVYGRIGIEQSLCPANRAGEK